MTAVTTRLRSSPTKACAADRSQSRSPKGLEEDALQPSFELEARGFGKGNRELARQRQRCRRKPSVRRGLGSRQLILGSHGRLSPRGGEAAQAGEARVRGATAGDAGAEHERLGEGEALRDIDLCQCSELTDADRQRTGGVQGCAEEQVLKSARAIEKAAVGADVLAERSPLDEVRRAG